MYKKGCASPHSSLLVFQHSTLLSLLFVIRSTSTVATVEMADIRAGGVVKRRKDKSARVTPYTVPTIVVKENPDHGNMSVDHSTELSDAMALIEQLSPPSTPLYPNTDVLMTEQNSPTSPVLGLEDPKALEVMSMLTTIDRATMFSFLDKETYGLKDVAAGSVITIHTWEQSSSDFGPYPSTIASFMDKIRVRLCLPKRFLARLPDRELPLFMFYDGQKTYKGKDIHTLEFINPLLMKRMGGPSVVEPME